jgi:hypothetical protein
MNVLNRKFLTGILLCFLVFSAGYTYLWFYTAEKLEDWLIASIERLEKDGYQPSYDRIEIKGFPFKLEARLLNPCVQFLKPVPLKISGTGVVTASTSVWNPRQVQIKGNEKISFFLIGDEAEEFPLASVDQLNIKGALSDNFFHNYSINLKNLQIGTWKAQEISFDCVNDQSETPSDKVILKVDNMYFVSEINKVPLTSTIQQIALEANVSMPATFNGQLTSILKGWYEKEGVIDVSKMNIVWDDIRLEGSGTLSLDQELQPLGAFTVNVYGMDPMLKLMANQKLISKSIIPIIKTALSALLGAEDNQHKAYHSIPLSIQDRELSLAAIPIIKFDPIKWSEINF